MIGIVLQSSQKRATCNERRAVQVLDSRRNPVAVSAGDGEVRLYPLASGTVVRDRRRTVLFTEDNAEALAVAAAAAAVNAVIKEVA